MKSLHLIDPAVRDLIASVKLFDPESDPLDGFRAQLLATYPTPKPAAREEHFVSGTSRGRVLVYRPGEVRGPVGAVVYVHGGGFVAGTADMTDAHCLQLAAEHQAVVVSVDYRLAPETPFPGPLEDCFAALRWTLEGAPELGIGPGRVVLMGHSAGGGLAAATALLHRDRGGAPLAGQVLLYPMLDARTGTATAPADNPFIGEFGWTRAINRFAWRALSGGDPVPPEREGHFSPSLARDLAGLPPTFLAVGSVDLFLEEDIDYALRLSRAGVPVELHVYEGGIHGFDLFPGRLSERFNLELRAALARLLRSTDARAA